MVGLPSHHAGPAKQATTFADIAEVQLYAGVVVRRDETVAVGIARQAEGAASRLKGKRNG